MVSLVVSVAATLVWEIHERQAGSIAAYNWSPSDDPASIVVLIPVGMLMYSLHPIGWMFWSGLAGTVTTRNRHWLWLVAEGAMLLGLYWPTQCVGILGI